MNNTHEKLKVTRPVLRYHGGKFLLANWIIAHLPTHRIYCEPFCGAASVLMRKPRVYSEVINDLDGQICSLFRVLRDPMQARELERALRLTPYARTEFEAAYLHSGDPIEAARRLIVRSFMGFGSASVNSAHRTGFRSNSNRSGTTPAHDWMHYPDALPAFVERLRGVVIENRSAFDIITQHDTPETLFYLDPPYVHSTRYMGRESCVYRYDMSEDEHRELAERARSAQGMVVLSGYPSTLYDEELYADWKRIERPSHTDGARDRTEVLWFNAAAWYRLHDKQGAMEF